MTAPWPRMGVLNAGSVKYAGWQMSPRAHSLLRRSPKISAAVRYALHPLKNSCVWILAFLGEEEHVFL